MWATGREAYAQGFKDGYNGVLDTPVECFHRDYELGFILGWAARRGLW
jgi:hypothetical protein